MASLALVHIGINSEIALAMIVTQHVIQWLVVGMPGAFYFVVKMGGHIPEPEPVDNDREQDGENDFELKEAAR